MIIHRLLYRSEADICGNQADMEAEVSSIVQSSRDANARVGLTGALVYSRGIFVQALEGPLGAMENTFEKICCDLRHRRVELLEFIPAADRAFGEWLMAKVTPNLHMQQVISDLNMGATLADTPPTQAIVNLVRSMLLKPNGPVGNDPGPAPPAPPGA